MKRASDALKTAERSYMNDHLKSNITIFHCINAFSGDDVSAGPAVDGLILKTVKMACSSMVKDVFLLRAFESGADAVVVLVCPEGQCRYIEGNIRAQKRVAWVKKLLDEIDLDARRLTIHPIAAGNVEQVDQILREVSATLAELGPSPAK